MKKTYFTPGPTELYPEISDFIKDAIKDNICSISHRTNEFVEIYKHTVKQLKQLLNVTDDFQFFFLASATECMDRIIQNTVEERSFHFVNGAFAERFYKTAVELGKKPAKREVPYGEGFDFESISIAGSPELICFTQNETSTGVSIPFERIYEIKDKVPDSLTAVDIVTSSPYIEIDFTKIDCAFFSVQKGFGMPAGLGVLIANNRCIEKTKFLKSLDINIGSYHNFLSLNENAVKFQTTETPNVLAIYLLGRVCEMLNAYGIKRIRKETEQKAELFYDFFDSHRSFKPFVEKKEDRSKTIVIAEVNERQSVIRKQLSESGFVVGSGYGKFKDSQIRIANFPMHQIKDVMKIIKILEGI